MSPAQTTPQGEPAPSENITGYLRGEKRSFAEKPVSDADLLACASFAYMELERYPQIAADEPAIRDLPSYGSLWSLSEHDCNPDGMYPLLQALVASPRFADLRIRDFSCTVGDAPATQFGALCLPLSDDEVVVAFRGTDTKDAGWLEDFEMLCNGPMPCQEMALAYLERAAQAYPHARLYVCGHSKGGACAEYATVFADAALQQRIVRTVSFDGPALYRLGGERCPELAQWDLLVSSRYRRLWTPLTRYIFSAKIGLMFEPPASDLDRYPFADCVDEALPHNVCSVRIVDGDIVLRIPEPKELYDGLHLSRCTRELDYAERVELPGFFLNVFRDAGVPVDLSYSASQTASMLLHRYRRESPEVRVLVRSAFQKYLKTR